MVQENSESDSLKNDSFEDLREQSQMNKNAKRHVHIVMSGPSLQDQDLFIKIQVLYLFYQSKIVHL